MKVRIIKCDGKNKWYEHCIGNVVEIEIENRGYYFVKGNVLGIDKKDAEVVEDVVKSCEGCKFELDDDCINPKDCIHFSEWTKLEPTADKFRKLEFEKDLPEIVTNSKGGKQSKISTAFSLVPHKALLAVGKVMKIGSERYEKDNWRKLSADEIYDHLMEHLINWHKDGNMEDLEHAMTRAMMLYEVASDELY